jgi:hypothetical protein
MSAAKHCGLHVEISFCQWMSDLILGYSRFREESTVFAFEHLQGYCG